MRREPNLGQSIHFKRLVGSTTFTRSIYLSKASVAAVTTGRSAAAVVRRPGGQWSVLPGLGKATNQELGGCSCLQVECRGALCVWEGCRQQVSRWKTPTPHTRPCTRWRCCTQLSTCWFSPSSSSSGWGWPAGSAVALCSSSCPGFSPWKLPPHRTESSSFPGSGAAQANHFNAS